MSFELGDGHHRGERGIVQQGNLHEQVVNECDGQELVITTRLRVRRYLSCRNMKGILTTPSVPPVASTLPSLLKRVTFYKRDIMRLHKLQIWT